MSEKKQEQAPADKKTLYLCDWRKNTKCPRKSCLYNPNGFPRACSATFDRDFAVLDEDGKPIVVPDWSGKHGQE